MKKFLFLLALVVPLLFVSCSKDDDPDVISLKVLEKTLNFEDEYQIEASSKAPIKYTVENQYHATVSESGLLTAGFVGETNIKLDNGEDSKTFKVIVKPKSNLYTEPDVKFGELKSSIIGKFGTPRKSESSTVLLYSEYSNTAPIIMFLFDSSNKLTGYSLMVKSSYSSTLANFIIERYMAVTESNGLYMFVNGLTPSTTTMAVALKLYNTTYWQVLYSPYTSSAASGMMKSNVMPTHEYDALMKQLD